MILVRVTEGEGNSHGDIMAVITAENSKSALRGGYNRDIS